MSYLNKQSPIKFKYIIILILGFLFKISFASNIPYLNDSTYLYAPTGEYSVGYKDFHWINEEICPDPYFNGKNQKDFSADNQISFCREIMTRIYYPSLKKFHKGDFEYPAMVKVWQDKLIAAHVPNITIQQIAALKLISTYTKQDLPAAGDEKFPIIFFDPGLDDDVEDYEDSIVDLVSHGYIVVAINNTFISSAVEFPDKRIVNYVKYASGEKMQRVAVRDIEFIYQKIQEQTIFTAMDKHHIGLFGHSLGAVATVVVTHRHPEWFQAAVAMAAPAYHGDYAAYQGFVIPFMHLHDANWNATYARHFGSDYFHLTPDEYFVLFTPDPQDINYTRHNNFSDFSTLQYQPTFAEFNQYEATTEDPYPLDVGTTNGNNVISITNNYLIQFFDYFIKNKKSSIFKNCAALQNTQLSCGPQVIEPFS